MNIMSIYRPKFAFLSNCFLHDEICVGCEISGCLWCAGSFQITGNPADTFMQLDVGGFRHGVAFVNGVNIGRYWSLGPQQTLYIPATLLHTDNNEVWLFELEAATQLTFYVDFRDTPLLDAPIDGPLPGVECTHLYLPAQMSPEARQYLHLSGDTGH